MFEWDASVTYGGEALRNVDYTVSTNESITSVEVTFSATDDGIIENVEDAVLALNGYIDWIAPDKGAGAFYQNILGELVFGELERVPISETLTVSINSLPNPVDQQIFAITGSDEPLLNLLEQPVDGDQESVSAKAENFSDSGFSISILENGDVVVTDAPDEVASTTVSYTVMDEFGAEAQAELTVSTATLLLRNPSTQLILTEGVAAPTFDFQLRTFPKITTTNRSLSV